MTNADARLEMTHASLPNELMAFFQRYADASIHGEPPAMAALYGPTFLVAGPKGSAAFTNDEKFLRWLSDLHTFNARQGMTSMTPVTANGSQLTPIHVLARVTWAARFATTGTRDITFDISYVLERSGDSWKVLGYFSETDQEDEMKKLDLL
jgi:hypothetical protein